MKQIFIFIYNLILIKLKKKIFKKNVFIYYIYFNIFIYDFIYHYVS